MKSYLELELDYLNRRADNPAWDVSLAEYIYMVLAPRCNGNHSPAADTDRLGELTEQALQDTVTADEMIRQYKQGNRAASGGTNVGNNG